MVHIFYMNLSGDCSYEQSLALYRLLPEERKQKVKSAKQENAAKKRLYTGAFLQYVLSKETGIPMDDISYIYGGQGKPEIDYGKLGKLPNNYIYNKEEIISHKFHFSLSHSGEYAVIAVSDRAVGIDIEHKTRNYQSIAKRCFCKEEYEDIKKADTLEEQEKRFLQYWSMKEAFIKRSGEGLSVPLNSFRILRQDAGLSCVEGQNVWFAGFFLEKQSYCISLCSESEQDMKAIMIGNNMPDSECIEITLGNIYHDV